MTPLGIEHATFWLVAQSQWVTGEIPSRIKQPGDEAGHSPPANAKVMNKQSYTSVLLYAFTVHRNNDAGNTLAI
jgi:hypothetical protein